jgi:antitoxin Phd
MPNRKSKSSIRASRKRAAQTGASFTATQAKNKFGHLLERVLRGDRVVITKHDAPKAILLSMEEFTSLSQRPQQEINTLSAEFDALLARMQRPGQRRVMQAAFRASPKELGAAAVEAARRRG